jgi:hypothetical protein
MTYSIADLKLKKALNHIDWKLLLFLIFFLNVKLAVKIPAIIIIYLLRFNFSFKFSFKNSRLPLFYLFIIALSFISLFINKSYESPNYIPLFLTGIVFWGLCLLAIHQVKLSVENNDAEVIHNTILIFFVINAFLSFFTIAHIIEETGAINPYRYQGEYQKYFIGTGDYIRGLTFDVSTTNAVLNAFGVIYFLVRKKPVMLLVCMAVLLLTGSNFTNLALMLVLVLLFVLKTNRDQKSLIVICVMFLAVFMAKVSPQNDQYAFNTFVNAIHPPKSSTDTIAAGAQKATVLSADEMKHRLVKNYLDSIKAILNNKVAVKRPARYIPYTGNGRYIIPGADINTPPYQTPTDTTADERQLLAFINVHKADLTLSSQSTFTPGLPGKAIGMIQTVTFLRHHPAKMMTGGGIGNFSSKLAFRATALGFAGGYPAKHAYISNDFMLNHLDVYLNFFSKRSGLHTLTNSPYSVYDQVLAEYGILGLLVFCVFYLGFFLKPYKQLTYGIPLLLLILAVFFIDYWFEQLSVIVFFELLLLLNIKETTLKQAII